MSDAITRKILEVDMALATKEIEMATLRTRIINAVGHLSKARDLRAANLDYLIMDVTALCALKSEVAALLRQQLELGTA